MNNFLKQFVVLNFLTFLIFIGSLFGQSGDKNSSDFLSLETQIKNHTAYFLEKERIRHNKYELFLRQKSKITPKLNTVVSGRFGVDAALYPDKHVAPQAGLPKKVRDEEYTDVSPREIYLDYLGKSLRMKSGLQIIDWVDSLSPLSSDVLTPLDLRFGGFGDSEDVIVPVFGFNLNHLFHL